jgi:hypothetical protein
MHNMATQSLLAKILATARDRSAAMMRRFLDTGDVACDFDSDDDDDEDDDDNILHFDLCRPAAAVMFNNGNHVAPRQIAAQAPSVPPKKQDPNTLARIKRTPCGGGTTWQMPHVLTLHSTPTEDWPVFFAVIFTCLSSCFKNWWSLLGIGGGPHGMTTMFVGLGNRCLIWN